MKAREIGIALSAQALGTLRPAAFHHPTTAAAAERNAWPQDSTQNLQLTEFGLPFDYNASLEECPRHLQA